MSNQSYSFHSQLKLAVPEEAKAVEVIKSQIPLFADLEHKPGKEHPSDAFSASLNEWLELKIDMTSYPNHFVERYSVKHDLKPGGPWQYAEKNVKYYAFCYLQLKEIHIFETKTLQAKMEELLATGKILDRTHGKDVKQKGAKYVTYGYALRKEMLKDIEIYRLKY